jgi:CubicO group peptidase (beta-lactamase class C family)
MNTRAFHATEMPAANGITDARSLARMYASLVGDGVDGVRLLNDETIAKATAEQSSGRDEVLWVNNRFALGFSLNSEDGNLGQEGAFGHSGAGGSLGFADPKAEIGFGYVMNQMQLVAADDPRTLTLIAAVHESLKG